jgi:sugar/nucleoside kinase (ribokinase family)
MKIICIGSSAKDVFYPTDKGQVVDTPDDLESQKKFCFELGAKYQVDDRFESIGGCAANVACGLARLGIEAACYTKVGDDYIGNWIKNELEKSGVNVSLVEIEKNCKSDLSAIIVDKNSGEHTIFFNRDANKKLEIIPEKLAASEWFFISALNGDWKGNLEKIIQIAKENNTKIIMNPGQSNIKEDYRKVVEAIKNSELVMVNKDEAIEIIDKIGEFSKDDLNDELFLMKKIIELGPQMISLTDGTRGAWGGGGEIFYHVDTAMKNPIETTGAGDAFSSGFIASYIKGNSMEECLKWGIANSASSLKFYGATGGLLRQEEMLEKIKEIKIEKV